MTEDLDKALVKDFPNLYKQCRYLACGDGWEPLIRRLSEKLEPLGVVAEQVKEKFGTLRFYLEDTDFDASEAYRLVDEAEKESKITCEICGSAGTLRGRATGRYWVRTLCDACHITEPK